MKKTFIIGSTGAMGSAVIHALLKSEIEEHLIIAMTRDLESTQAQELEKMGEGRLRLVAADLDDPASLRRAMKGADRVFCNTAFFSSGSIAGERRQGLDALEVARELGVEHFVSSSLDPASRLSGGRLPVPHYDSKASVEADIDRFRSDEFMKQEDGFYTNNVSVIVTAPYIENFYDFFAPEDGTLSDGRQGKIFRGPISGDGVWQMVALADLGEFARIILEDREKWGGRTLRIASEEKTMPQIVAEFEDFTGIASEFRPMSEQEFLASGLPHAHDPLNNMLIYREGYYVPRDFTLLRKLHPGLHSFTDWLRESGWRGEARAMRKNAATGDI